ncbi:MAG: hypothetical protein OEZ22_14905 [Spirochaetia bacterium]|nr:hypothetical protein [Spirochaetia bacterium]
MTNDEARNLIKVTVSDISKIQNTKEIESKISTLNSLIMDIPNFNSDLYQGVTFAISLLNSKMQSISNKRQYFINITIALAVLLNGFILVGINILKLY